MGELPKTWDFDGGGSLKLPGHEFGKGKTSREGQDGTKEAVHSSRS